MSAGTVKKRTQATDRTTPPEPGVFARAEPGQKRFDLVVTAGQKKERIDKFLAAQLEHSTREKIQK